MNTVVNAAEATADGQRTFNPSIRVGATPTGCTKFCSKCRRLKPLSDFNRKGRGYQSWCRVCNKARSKAYYADHLAEHRAAVQRHNKAVRVAVREFIAGYLTKHPCVDCGEKDIVVLDFDHVRGQKLANVSRFAQYSVSKTEAEIKKCEVVCANCHRRRTAKRHGGWLKFHWHVAQ